MSDRDNNRQFELLLAQLLDGGLDDAELQQLGSERRVVEMDDTTITTRALMVTISNGAFMGLAILF